MSSSSGLAGTPSAAGDSATSPSAARGDVPPSGSQAQRIDGPATVVRPQRRAHALPLEGSTGGSTLWNRLFPPENELLADPQAGAPAGLQLDHFVIEERIGTGGMGAVFRALDTRLKRVVALKVLSPAQSHDPAAVERFHNEAQAAARLDHDNIARVFYVGEDQGLHFIAFEFVTGTNVRQRIAKKGRLSPAEAVNYTLQIAFALKHTSQAGVVHRDIKPSNIIITPTGRAKLVDLGLARRLDPDSGELTLAGTTLGTFDYISPEQAKDPRQVDVRSDIYSLGCTLYHMLTGEPPYPEGTVLQKLLDHQGKEPPDPAERNRHVPPRLSAIVKRMMASDPRRRYQTPDELIRDLMVLAAAMGLRGGSPDGLVWTSARMAGPTFWERNLGWIVTVAILLLAVVLLERFPGIGHPGPAATTLLPQNGGAAEIVDGVRREGSAAADSATTGAEGTGADIAIEEGQPRTDRADPVADVASGAGEEPGRLTTDGDIATSGEPRGVGGTSQPPVLSHLFGSKDLPLIVRDSEQWPFGPPLKAPAVTPEMLRDPAGSVARSDVVDSSTPLPVGPSIVVEQEGREPVAFATLEAAIAAAEDGSAVVLQAVPDDRPLVVKRPLKISDRRITIRAAAGARRTIVFAPESNVTPTWLTVSGGSVQLINLDVIIEPQESLDAPRWVAVAMDRPEEVRLKGVTITVRNPSLIAAAVVEFKPGPSRRMPDPKMMSTGDASSQPAAELRVSESYIRGECDLVVVEDTQPVRVDLRQSAIVVDGALLRVLGDLEPASETARHELTLEHVTALLGESLLAVDTGELGREVTAWQISARDNILATRNALPLVQMTGQSDAATFRRLLTWKGEKNFYDGFAAFWVIESQDGDTTLDFESWKRTWGSSTETTEQNRTLPWSTAWWEADFSDLPAAGIRLETEPDPSLPLPIATDGHVAGVDPKVLP